MTDSSRAWTVVGLVLLAAVVGAFLYTLDRENWEAHPIVAVTGSAEGTNLDVTIAHAACGDGKLRADADESDPTVVVLSAEYDVNADCDDIGLRTTVTVELDRSLGDRKIRVALPGRELDCEIADVASDPCA